MRKRLSIWQPFETKEKSSLIHKEIVTAYIVNLRAKGEIKEKRTGWMPKPGVEMREFRRFVRSEMKFCENKISDLCTIQSELEYVIECIKLVKLVGSSKEGKVIA